jgi:CelD/BcsL family acetyltransferase involved in cellulose biosynthesis
MRTQLIRNPNDLTPIRPLWNRLHAAGGHSLFQSFAWNLLAAKYFADRELPAVAVAEGDSGAAIIPACVRDDGSLSLLGETLFDYRRILHCGEQAALTAAWQCLAVLNKSLHYTAHRDGDALPSPSTTLNEFAAAPAVLRSLPVARHPRLERYLRALKKQGCELRRYPRPDHDLLRYIYAQKAAQQGSLFADTARQQMAVAMLESIGTRCEVFTLETAGTLVAALITFIDGGWRRCYTTYFDPAWQKYSPGAVLLHEVVKLTLQEGRDCDLMTGEQPYKSRLANSRIQLYHASVTAQAMRTHVSAGAEAA